MTKPTSIGTFLLVWLMMATSVAHANDFVVPLFKTQGINKELTDKFRARTLGSMTEQCEDVVIKALGDNEEDSENFVIRQSEIPNKLVGNNLPPDHCNENKCEYVKDLGAGFGIFGEVSVSDNPKRPYRLTMTLSNATDPIAHEYHLFSFDQRKEVTEELCARIVERHTKYRVVGRMKKPSAEALGKQIKNTSKKTIEIDVRTNIKEAEAMIYINGVKQEIGQVNDFRAPAGTYVFWAEPTNPIYKATKPTKLLIEKNKTVTVNIEKNFAYVEIDSQPGGAQISLDPKPPRLKENSRTPNDKFKIQNGTYKLTLRKDGFGDTQRTLIVDNLDRKVNVTLNPKHGILKILTNVPAPTIRINGVERIPDQDIELRKGEYEYTIERLEGDTTIRISKEGGYKENTWSGIIKPGKTTPVKLYLKSNHGNLIINALSRHRDQPPITCKLKELANSETTSCKFLKLKPNRYTWIVSARGHQTRSEEIVIKDNNRTEEIRVDLTPNTGTLKINPVMPEKERCKNPTVSIEPETAESERAAGLIIDDVLDIDHTVRVNCAGRKGLKRKVRPIYGKAKRLDIPVYSFDPAAFKRANVQFWQSTLLQTGLSLGSGALGFYSVQFFNDMNQNYLNAQNIYSVDEQDTYYGFVAAGDADKIGFIASTTALSVIGPWAVVNFYIWNQRRLQRKHMHKIKRNQE